MKKIYNVFAIVLLCIAFGSAQVAKAQSRALPILETQTDARSAAMGGVSLMSTDRSYLYVNPTSLLYGDKKMTISASGLLFNSPDLKEIESIEGNEMFTGVSLGYRFLDRHVVYAGFRYQGGLKILGAVSGQFEENTKKSYTPFDWSVDLGYAFRFTDQWAAFATGSFIQSYTGRTAYAGAFSVGANFNSKLQLGNYESMINVAAKVADFGTPVYYSTSDAYALPTNAQLSADLAMPFDANNKLNVALGGKYYFLPTDAQLIQVGVGAEYTLYNMVSLRAGYQYGTRETSNWGAGIGVEFYDVKLDFGYVGGLGSFKSNQLLLTLSFDY